MPSGFSFTVPLICTAKTFTIEYSFFFQLLHLCPGGEESVPPFFFLRGMKMSLRETNRFVQGHTT